MSTQALQARAPDPSRRTLITAAAALAGGAAVNVAAIVAAKAETVPQPTEPIFDLIEQHRDLYSRMLAGCDARLGNGVIDRMYNDAEDALDDLLEASPTTLAGCIALLRYVEERCDGDYDWVFGAESAAGLLSRIADTLAQGSQS